MNHMHMQNQSPFEFMGWNATPGEKHMGIATIRLERRFIIRFKVAPSSNGQGLWVTVASYKTGTKPDGKDAYESAFEFDSSYERKQAESFIESQVQAIISRPNPNASPSAFAAPNYYQPQATMSPPSYASMSDFPSSQAEDQGLPF
jgi:hypothetical protein